MAINKISTSKTLSHGAMRNCIEYVLRDDKVNDGYVLFIGPYDYSTITYDNVYQAFLNEKKIWNKDMGRMYAHHIISFHKDEKISPSQCLEIGKAFAEEFFHGHQCLICLHHNKKHLHCHIVSNSVSYLEGKKLHHNKKDLEKQKQFTNELCRSMGLSVAEKGKHFDGTPMEKGEIISWSKDKYNLIINKSKKSYLVNCALSIMEALPLSSSKEEFITGMKEKGWDVIWSDKRKHIVFSDVEGRKVRDSNISKTFNMNISKEALDVEFRRNEANKQFYERSKSNYPRGINSEIPGRRDGIPTNSKRRAAGRH